MAHIGCKFWLFNHVCNRVFPLLQKYTYVLCIEWVLYNGTCPCNIRILGAFRVSSGFLGIEQILVVYFMHVFSFLFSFWLMKVLDCAWHFHSKMLLT